MQIVTAMQKSVASLSKKKSKHQAPLPGTLSQWDIFINYDLRSKDKNLGILLKVAPSQFTGKQYQ